MSVAKRKGETRKQHLIFIQALTTSELEIISSFLQMTFDDLRKLFRNISTPFSEREIILMLHQIIEGGDVDVFLSLVDRVVENTI